MDGIVLQFATLPVTRVTVFTSSSCGAVVVRWIAGLIRVVDCIGVAATRVVCFLLETIVGVEGDLSTDVYITRRGRWKVRHFVRGIDKAKGLFKQPRGTTNHPQAFVVRAEGFEPNHGAGRIVMAHLQKVSDGVRNGERGKCRAETVASNGEFLARPSDLLELGMQRVDKSVVHCVPALFDLNAGRRIGCWRAIRYRIRLIIYKEVRNTLATSEDEVKATVGFEFDDGSVAVFSTPCTFL